MEMLKQFCVLRDMNVANKKMENMSTDYFYPQWKTICWIILFLQEGTTGSYFGNADVSEDAVVKVSYVERLFNNHWIDLKDVLVALVRDLHRNKPGLFETLLFGV